MRPKWLASLALVSAVVLATTLNAARNPFVWDDAVLDEERPNYERVTWPTAFFAPRHWNEHHPTPRAAYRPLREASLWLDVKLWGVNPIGHRATVAALHALNCLAVCIAAWWLFGSHRLALVAGLLFAAHPIHTEALAMVKNRGELMACLFMLIGFALFVRAMRPGVDVAVHPPRVAQASCLPSLPIETSGAGRMPALPLNSAPARGAGELLYVETPEPQRGWAYGLALVAFAAALLSKSIGVALPALLVVYGLCVERGRNARRLLVATIPFWCVALAFFAFKAVTLKSGTWAGGRAALTFRERVARPLETLSRYSLQLPMPIDLHNDYAPKLNPETLLGPVLVTGGALTLAAVGVAKLWRVSPPAAFVALWMALTILPVSNLIPLRARPIAEQRLYIPSVGWVILLAWLVMARGRPAHRALTALLLAAAALLAGLSAERYFAWRTGIALWTDSVAKSADRVRAYMNLGNEYLIDRRYAQAEKFFRKTIRLSPQTTDAYMNLAQTLRSQGRPSEALQVYRKAQAHDPRNPALHAVVAHVQAEMGDYESALNSFRLALRLYPRMPAAHNRLGQLYLALERPQDAVLPFRVAAGLEPDSPHHHFGLGNAFQMLGQSHRALACYAEAIRLSPTYKEAHFNAGESLQAMGQDELAERAFQVVLQLDPANWRAHFKLAEICQQRGNAALSAHHLDAAARLSPALLSPAPK